MSFSIDGLSSGLDTTSIINQLMRVERMPITRLESRQTTIESRKSVWNDLDAKLSSLRTLASDLTAGGRLGAMAATSSAEELATATAAPGASSGSFQFSVESLAASHQLLSGGFASATSLVGAGRVELATGLAGLGAENLDASGAAAGTYALTVSEVSGGTATVTYDGVEQTVASTGAITLTDSQGGTVSFDAATGLTVGSASVAVVETDGTTTVSQLATDIDATGIGASASVLNVGGTDPSRIFLSADGAGSANAIEINSDLAALSGGNVEELRAATDAVLDLGNGFQITRSSNRVEDLLPGVTIDLRKADPGTTVTVNVSNDVDSLVEDVGAMVDALNDVLNTTNKARSSDPEAGTKGALSGDSRAFTLTSQLRTALSHAVPGGDYAVLGQVGIEVQQDGTFLFKEDELREALAADPDGVRRLLAGDGAGEAGVIGELVDTVDALTGTNGLVDAAVDGADNEIRRIGGDIARYEERMDLVETRLRRQFAGLETMLQQMNAQMSQLQQSIANL
ncbi:MAG: flagellar filament capping protein FliD [Actinomycetota bacterium]|nr:flagellar filament capping protein FliD [Actinomycetota bacterium]